MVQSHLILHSGGSILGDSTKRRGGKKVISKPKFSRLHFIDRKIREGTYPNAKTLAREYETSDRTIKRDIEYLRDFQNAPIEYDSHKKGYYYSEENYALPALTLKSSELFAITLVQEVLTQYENTPVYTELLHIFEKLSSLLPENVTVDVGWLDARFTMFREPSANVDFTIWKSLFKALQENKEIIIDYQTPQSTNPLKRTVAPFHAVYHKGNWYVIGHDSCSDEIRVFAFSRIKSVKLMEKSFSMPEDFTISDHLDTNIGVFAHDKKYKVNLKFSKTAAPFIKERVWHDNQDIHEFSNGSIKLMFSTNQLNETLFWVLSWGENVEVVSPPELKNMVKERLQKMIKIYGLA